MTLCISACEPTRIASTLRVEAVTESVRVTPCTSARTQRKTATTRPITTFFSISVSPFTEDYRRGSRTL